MWKAWLSPGKKDRLKSTSSFSSLDQEILKTCEKQHDNLIEESEDDLRIYSSTSSVSVNTSPQQQKKERSSRQQQCKSERLSRRKSPSDRRLKRKVKSSSQLQEMTSSPVKTWMVENQSPSKASKKYAKLTPTQQRLWDELSKGISVVKHGKLIQFTLLFFKCIYVFLIVYQVEEVHQKRKSYFVIKMWKI